jgi:hypothetical protein
MPRLKLNASEFTGRDLTGVKVGRWTILGFSRRVRYKGKSCIILWRAKCDCGKEKDIANTFGASLSCGCYRRSVSATINRKHGMANRHPLYSGWKGMRSRCLNPNNPKYPRYGGRGIVICKQWSDFSVFVNDMFPTWKRGLTIHRVDNNGNYEPSNCLWATNKTQSNVRSANRTITHSGLTLTLSQWSEKTGIPYYLIHSRFSKGWNPDRIFNKQLRP